MRKLVVTLFVVSDWFCYLIILTGVLGAVLSPIILAQSTFLFGDPPAGALSYFLHFGFFVVLVTGAWAVRKRRLVGLLALMLPAAILSWLGAYAASALSVAVILLVFATPYLVVFIMGPAPDRAAHEA